MNTLKIKSELEKNNFRFNILTVITYIVGIVLIVQLFNLQIVNGEEYRANSNTRLSRNASIEAARGSILDSSRKRISINRYGIFFRNVQNES